MRLEIETETSFSRYARSFGIEICFGRSSRWEKDYNKYSMLVVRFWNKKIILTLFHDRTKKKIDTDAEI
jgi:hypothetical protein